MNRPHQQKALDGSVAKWKAGVYRQLHVMATGTGKTHCFAQLPKVFQPYLPGKMLVLAHREELIDQAIAKIQFENPLARIDKEKAEHVADPSQADIVVASVASMAGRFHKYDWDLFDKFVIDEAHHSTADSYMEVLDAANVWEGNKLLTGWTATPQRGDGEALAKVYSEVVTFYDIRSAIEDGWLVDVRGYKVRTDTSLDGVTSTAGDFAAGSLAKRVNTPERNLQIYKAWLELAEDRQTIGFCVNIKHAQDLAELFRKHDVLAEAVWGKDPLRAEKLAKFSAGEIEVIFNVDVLTEGYDEWKVECILNCAPTKSPVKYTQRVGRGTRLQPQYGNLKEYKAQFGRLHEWLKQDCVVIDMADMYTRNSLITLPTLMGLPNTTDLQGKSMVWAAKQLEDAQKEFPHVDFSKLPDLSKIKQFIEEVSLFDPVFPEETEQSELSWHGSLTGGYSLMLPNKEYIRIKQNLLDEFELEGYVKETKYKGVRGTLAEALSVADTLVQKVIPEALRVVKKEQAWHNDSATSSQIKALKKFYKGKQIPQELKKGAASRMISAYLAGRK